MIRPTRDVRIAAPSSLYVLPVVVPQPQTNALAQIATIITICVGLKTLFD
jgi:hypothetical protein